MSKKNSVKNWPRNCVWPKPANELSYGFCDVDDAHLLHLDEYLEDLLEIKDYYDNMLDEGLLDDDYRILKPNPILDKYSDDLENIEQDFIPEKGEEYWDEGFDYACWEIDFYSHLALLKIEPKYSFNPDNTISSFSDPVADIQQVIGYEFINENLLRQAFTRRSFGIEYGTGDYENLELVGDTVLNTVVTREIVKQLTEVYPDKTSGPFVSSYKEGDLSHLRENFVSKDHLSSRLKELGFEKYILYGPNETKSDDICEDVMESLIGAAAIDSNWNWAILEDIVDKLICMNMTNPSDLINAKFYDMFNSWHQKHFKKNPEYEIIRIPSKDGNETYDRYTCAIRFMVPGEGEYKRTHKIEVEASTRSKSREQAAEFAYRYIVKEGLWMNLKDADIEPKLDDAINQLQELKQKKYVKDIEYQFEQFFNGIWYCSCVCDGIYAWGNAKRKIDAKKQASYGVLLKLMESAGIANSESNDNV